MCHVRVLALAVLVASGCGGSVASPEPQRAVPEPPSGAPAPSDPAPPATSGGSTAAPVGSDPAPASAVCGTTSAACSRVECSALGPDCSPAWDCGAPEVCKEASFLYSDGTSSSGGGTSGYTTNGPDTKTNAECILAALRDGKVGRVSFSIATTYGGHHETIDVVAARRAFGTFSESDDSPTIKGGYAAAPLRDAAYFDQCLSKANVDAYARCIKDAVAPCP